MKKILLLIFGIPLSILIGIYAIGGLIALYLYSPVLFLVVLMILVILSFLLISYIYRRCKKSKYAKSQIHEFGTTTMDINVVGTFYREKEEQERAQKLNIGETVFLLPEPENEYDRKAIMVVTQDGYHVGYIGKDINSLVMREFSFGNDFYVNVHYLDTNKKPWEIIVSMRKIKIGDITVDFVEAKNKAERILRQRKV